jgi:hypothetical protein
MKSPTTDPQRWSVVHEVRRLAYEARIGGETIEVPLGDSVG